jgi:hypothetical protein
MAKSAAAKAIKAKMSEMHQSIAGVRAQLDGLKAERERISSLPIPFDEAAAGLDERIGSLVSKYRADWAIGRLPYADRELADVEIAPALGIDVIGDPLAIAFVFFSGDQIRDKLKKELRQQYTKLEKAGPTPMATAEREAALVKIDESIRKVESEEEELILEAEEIGLSIPRREDADPEIFLEVAR